jgi:hypothetical protein
MIHLCTCGFELAPEDGVPPVGAVSTGLCAPCAARSLRSHAPFWYPVCIEGYQIQLRIQPGSQPPTSALIPLATGIPRVPCE